MSLRASVVLCTYQGERFLGEQLASLRAQTRPAAEVIAQDDASTDSTFELLQGEGIRAFRNHTRLGFAANFASALARANGDILFFCDQDDIWEPEKIAVMLAHFERDPLLQILCCEASKIDEKGASFPGLVLEGNGFGHAERAPWNLPYGAIPSLVRRNCIPGMTMAIRSSLREKILPLPVGWEHDYWTLLIAAGLGHPIAFEDRALVRYRMHGGQVMGGEKSIRQRWDQAERLTLRNRTMESARWASLLERISGAEPSVLALIEEKRAFLEQRSGYSSSRLLRAAEIFGVFLQGKYHRLDAGFSSAVKDFLSGT
jgi:glycosyltransferase involved in cell wall biosynthesis